MQLLSMQSRTLLATAPLWLAALLSTNNGNMAEATQTSFPYDTLVSELNTSLTNGPTYPGLNGYCGWNYECALALWAVILDRDSSVGLNTNLFSNSIPDDTLSQFLKESTDPPQPGAHIDTALFLYSPGDRIGLFGGLYNEDEYTSSISTTAQHIVNVVGDRLEHWPTRANVFSRRTGWGGPLGLGLSLEPIWIWADDSYIGGLPLVFHNPDLWGNMILNYTSTLQDTDGLWFHGAKVEKSGLRSSNPTITVNGVKWSRANGWLLLALTSFLLETSAAGATPTVDPSLTSQVETVLSNALANLVQFQRATGAFGNVVDEASSPDETSLTTVYVFATGAAQFLQHERNMFAGVDLSGAISAANNAYNWLDGRTLQNFTVSDTCGSQQMATSAEDYNKNVGQSTGPGVALFLWARVGKALLDRYSA